MELKIHSEVVSYGLELNYLISELKVWARIRNEFCVSGKFKIFEKSVHGSNVSRTYRTSYDIQTYGCKC